MAFAKNKYYSLAELGSEATSAADTILKHYPLTKIFLEILGRYLLDQLQFGIFSPHYPIIKQGEKGKDLFLLCSHQIDVSVNGKMIVQMGAPTLVGDKGIIDKNSIRNATISVSEGDDCLVIRIPMALFIRSFAKQEIKDREFIQERQIYYHLFMEIQERLFKYSVIQRNLWEEINTRIQSLNTQLITGILARKEDKNWDDVIWPQIAEYFRKTYRFEWPNHIAINIKTVPEMLRKILDKSFPRASFSGSDQSYTFKKQTLWKRWINSLSEFIIKSLPPWQLPISIGEIELFNPRIYQLRMNRLLRSIEKNFMFRKVEPNKNTYHPDKLKAARFFGKGVQKHEFNLELYLKTILECFIVKSPNRVLAQVAQQVAQLSAMCENEFNVSVSKMQHFLEKIKKLCAVENPDDTRQKTGVKSVGKTVEALDKGFVAYHKRMMGQSQVRVGELRFNETTHPVVTELIHSCGTEHVRKLVEGAFQSLLLSYQLNIKNLFQKNLYNLYHICEAEPEDIVPPPQLVEHYWIPLTDGFMLETNETQFGKIQPGTILGGPSWDVTQTKILPKSHSWFLTLPKKSQKPPTVKKNLLFVIPGKKLPWRLEPNPLYDDFQRDYQPILQFLYDKYLGQLVRAEQLRDLLFERYAKISEIVITERKVREFESNKRKLSEQQYRMIIDLVIETLGIRLEKKSQMTSSLLSKQLYNSILEQTKRDFPKLTVEEQGNKAYTLWRFMQSEIVNSIVLKNTKDQIKLDTPKSVFSLIGNDVEKCLLEESVSTDNPGVDLTSSPPELNLDKILSANKAIMTDQRMKISLTILESLENHMHRLFEEIADYEKRLKEISSIETEFDIKEITSKFLMEAVEKLQNILVERIRNVS